jgi:hypothetical protein
MDSSDEPENAPDSIRVHCEGDSNKSDESDLHCLTKSNRSSFHFRQISRTNDYSEES